MGYLYLKTGIPIRGDFQNTAPAVDKTSRMSYLLKVTD